MKVFRERQYAPQAQSVSRRTLVGGACLLVTCATAGAVSAAAPSKVPQKEAGYRNAPRGGARCETCSQFLAPSSCKLVAGPISPSGWCSFFAPRAG